MISKRFDEFQYLTVELIAEVLKMILEFLMNHQLMKQLNEEQKIFHILHVQYVILSMIKDMQYLIDHQ
jgi:hypothetical protein